MARTRNYSRARKARLVRNRREGRQAGSTSVIVLFGSAFGGLALVSVLCVATVLLSLVAGTGLVYASFAGEMQTGLDRIRNIDQLSAAFQTTRIYDRNGKLLYEVFDEGRRTKVKLQDIPQSLIDATIATEDETFYQNPGVDVQGVARAIYRYVCCQDVIGGSTITQQLVRHVAFSYEERVSRDPKRKIKEILLALELNQMKSKNQILELYLNEIYYGDLAYGIEAAAQTFFGKNAHQLDLAESAMLAGLPQSPAELDPLDPASRSSAKERQRIVLQLMVKHGYLTQAQANQAFAEELRWAPPERGLAEGTLAPHFIVYVRKLLEDRYGPDLVARGGLRVTTTLDSNYQQLAERTVRNQVQALRNPYDLTDSALVAMRPGTGEVLAMVGSPNYWDNSIYVRNTQQCQARFKNQIANGFPSPDSVPDDPCLIRIRGQVNVTTSARQPGSSMKPLTYSLAFERGLTPADVVWDVSLNIPLGNGQVYTPHNYDFRFHGPVRLRQALANSYNIPAVQVMRTVGVQDLLQWTHDKLGLTTLDPANASQYGLSLTLGAGEVRPLDMSAAFAMFANGGTYVPPVAILKVEDSSGHVLDQYTPPQPRPVLDPRIAYQISSILSDNDARTPAFGANSPLKVVITGTNTILPAAVKTGTTNDYKDNWTVGYTPNLAIAVWAGNVDNREMRNVSGVVGAAPIWHDMMQTIYSDPALSNVIGVADPLHPPQFKRPDGIKDRAVCVLSSLKDPVGKCPATRTEIFLASPPRRFDLGSPQEPLAGGTPVSAAMSTPRPVSTLPASTAAISQTSIVPGVPVPVEEGIVKMEVVPLYQIVISGTQGITGTKLLSSTPPLFDASKSGSMALPPPRYCAVTSAADRQLGAVEQLFIVAPSSSTYRVPVMSGLPDAEAYSIQAQRWAAASGLAIAPAYACTPELLAQVGKSINAGGEPPAGATYTITSPLPGQTISGTVPIIGTVQFKADEVDYYKITIQGPNFKNNEEVTLGETHSNQVTNGVLELLASASLPPGPYTLGLELVKKDGNFDRPYEVPIIIVPPGGQPPGPQ